MSRPAICVVSHCCVCRFGGSITAALFLKNFIKEDVEWSHVDMAGPVWDDKAAGPTGYCAVSLAEWAMSCGRN